MRLTSIMQQFLEQIEAFNISEPVAKGYEKNKSTTNKFWKKYQECIIQFYLMQEQEYAWKKERKFAIYFHSIIQFERQSRTFGTFSITITF